MDQTRRLRVAGHLALITRLNQSGCHVLSVDNTVVKKMAAAQATLIRKIGDLREQYLDLLELVEQRTLHDPQPWPSLEKLYGKYDCYVYFTETQWDYTPPPRCMQNLRADLVRNGITRHLRADLVAIVERMLDEHAREAAEQVATQ